MFTNPQLSTAFPSQTQNPSPLQDSHTHNGVDRPKVSYRDLKDLPTQGSFTKGRATLSSGSVHISDASVTTASRIMATHNSAVAPTALGILALDISAGGFTIYSLKASGGGIVESSDTSVVDYIIFY